MNEIELNPQTGGVTGRDPVEVLAEEFIAQFRAGERPEIDDFVRRHPELAKDVRATFPSLLFMEGLAIDQNIDTTLPARNAPGAWDRMPARLGDYRIVCEVGRGGMGVVYEAEQVSLGRSVALKLLPPTVPRDCTRKQRFVREARAAARLHHTNIVPIFGVGAEDGLNYFVMQLIRGVSLDQALSSMTLESERTTHSTRPQAVEDTARIGCDLTDVSLPAGDSIQTQRGSRLNPGQVGYWKQVARIGAQVADALAYAHKQGIVHRDIKPSNLIIDHQGTTWVTDFGLASSEMDESVTGTGEVIGTLRYMAPEVFEGPADQRSDVYSLGLTLYELLAFRPAFPERNHPKLITHVIGHEPPPLSKLNPDVPVDLRTIVQRAIHPTPERRFQSAEELAADLRRFINDEPILARRVRLPERLLRLCRRNPGTTWSIAGSCLAVLTTLAVAVAFINGEKDRALELAHERGELAARNEQLLIEQQQANLELKLVLDSEEQQRQLALRAADDAQAVSDFLVLDMIGAANPDRSTTDTTVREMLERAVLTAGARFDGQPELEAAVRNAIGVAYHGLGRFDESNTQLAIAFDLRLRLLGPDHPDTIQTTVNLAANNYELGEYAVGRERQEQALAVLRDLYGPDHQLTVDTLANLGANLNGMGDYEQAHAVLEEALERRTNLYGPNDSRTLSTMSNLAVNLLDAGRFKEAEELIRRALQIKQDTLGAEAPSTLASLGNLAVSLDSQGKFDEAVRLNRQILNGRQRRLGAEHPDTLVAKYNLAGNLESLDRFDEAIRMYEEVIDSWTNTLGAEHPRILMALNNIAFTYMRHGQLDEARQRYESVLEMSRRTLGIEHPVTITVRQNLDRVHARINTGGALLFGPPSGDVPPRVGQNP